MAPSERRSHSCSSRGAGVAIIGALLMACCDAEAGPMSKAITQRSLGMYGVEGSLRLRGGANEFWLPGQGGSGGDKPRTLPASEVQARIKMLEEMRDDVKQDRDSKIRMLDELIVEMRQKLIPSAAGPATSAASGPTTRPSVAAARTAHAPAAPAPARATPSSDAPPSPPKKGFFRVIRSLSEQAIGEETNATETA